MADFTDQNIQDTYQRVVQIDSGQLQDGTGSVILSSTELSSIQAIGSPAITSTEWAELKNIGSAEISSTEWGYVASMQDVSTNSTPTFNKLALNGIGSVNDPILSFTGPTGSISNPQIGVTRGSAMFFHPIGNPDNLAITFINQNADLAATIDNNGTYRSLLGDSVTDAVNATNALKVNVASDTGNAEHPIIFIDDTSPDGGYEALKANASITINPSTNGLTLGQITASGDISASGDGIFNNLDIDGNIKLDNNAVIYSEYTNRGRIDLYSSNVNGNLQVRLQGDSTKLDVKRNAGIDITGNVTASGDISASGRIYGRQLEQIETNFGYDFDDGTFVYLPFSNQSTSENPGEATFTSININRVAVVPGKPIKSIIRATGNTLGNNTPYTMSYWEAEEGNPTTPILKAAVYADTDSDSNKDAIRFDWSSPNSGSTTDVAEGSRIYMSLESNNSANAGYIITHLWEWDYNSI